MLLLGKGLISALKSAKSLLLRCISEDLLCVFSYYAFAPTTRLLLLHVCSCYAFACRRSYSAFACQWRVDPPMCTTTIEGEDSIGGPWSVACCSLWVATRKCMHCLHQHFMSDIRQFVHFQDSGCDVWGDCCHCLKL